MNMNEQLQLIFGNIGICQVFYCVIPDMLFIIHSADVFYHVPTHTGTAGFCESTAVSSKSSCWGFPAVETMLAHHVTPKVLGGK